MNKMYLSIKIPCWKIIHFDSGKLVAVSKLACFKGFAHYDCYGHFIGKSVRNFIGELNHYDSNGKCAGYSRRSGFATTTHFSSHGITEGKTYSLCGMLFIHVNATE